jgi:hypothetical protein
MAYPQQAKIEPQNLSGKAGYNVVVNQTETGYTTAPSDSVTIPDTAYASNADAVAALGVGKLYKSSTLSVNGSPHILITV